MLRSIKIRLLVLLTATVMLTAITSIIMSYLETRHEINELFDAQLAQEARIIQSSFLANIESRDPLRLQELLERNSVLTPQQYPDSDDTPNPYGHVYERKVAFQIWHRQKGLLLRSLSAPQHALSPEGLSPETRGFHDANLANSTWRVFSTWDREEKILVQTAENYDVRNELVHEISEQLISTSLLFLPLLIMFILLAVSQGLRPLRLLEKQIQRRDPEKLDKIDIRQVPAEINSMVNALNSLLARIRLAFENERQFTDDAAHELRTPLAALKTQAQVALRSTDDDEKENALQQIIRGVDRMSHLVQQLLSLARLGQDKLEIDKKTVNLLQLASDTVSMLAQQLEEKNIRVNIHGDDALECSTDPGLLGMLLVNIMDNAVKYSNVDSDIDITVFPQGKRPCICIRDHGPGIKQELQERVFHRFYRISGSMADGCGLGLAIAQRSAELLQAQLTLQTPEHGTGLLVTLCMDEINS